MKKILLALVALIAFSTRSVAQLTNAQAVKIVVPYKTTCSSVTIGTSATELTGNTTSITTTAGISAIKVVNLSTTATVYCSQNAAVASSGNSIGDPLFPSSGQPYFLEWGISTAQGWSCVSSASNTSLIVCLVK